MQFFMDFKKLLLTIAVVLASTGISVAQQSKSDKSVEFRPNWNLQLQGGASYTLGEAKRSELAKLISPTAQLSAGYKFHHMLGVRVGVSGWQSKGGAVLVGQTYKFNYLQGSADLMLDLTSAFGGFNHRRVANVYLFAGAGVVGAFNNKEAEALAQQYTFDYLWTGSKCFAAGRFGVGIDFRCSDLISVGLEGNANFLSDKFNSKNSKNLDWNFNLLAGVNFHFGKNHRPSKAYAEAKAKEEAVRVATEKAAEAKKVEEARVAAEKAEAEKVAAEKAEAERIMVAKMSAEKAAAEKNAAERAAIAKVNSTECLFLLGSYKIRSSEAKKIDQLAKWLKANTDYEVLIVGYADKETGSPKVNMELSLKRAQEVQKRLLSNGVEKERIIVDAKGDTEQPFAQPERNRVVLCIVQ